MAYRSRRSGLRTWLSTRDPDKLGGLGVVEVFGLVLFARPLARRLRSGSEREELRAAVSTTPPAASTPRRGAATGW